MPYVPRDVADYFVIQNPKPGRHYRWLSADPNRLSRWLMSFGPNPGYQLECGPTLEDTRRIAGELGRPELVDEQLNRIKIGNLYLGSIPEEEYRRRLVEKREEVEELRTVAQDDFMDRASRIPHVRPFVNKEVEEIEDRKSFAQRPTDNRVGYTKS